MSTTTHHPIEPWAANLILIGVNRLDCAITTLGCVMMDLDDQDDPTVEAIKWVYEMLRAEALNIRQGVEMARDPASCMVKAKPVPSEAPRVLEVA